MVRRPRWPPPLLARPRVVVRVKADLLTSSCASERIAHASLPRLSAKRRRPRPDAACARMNNTCGGKAHSRGAGKPLSRTGEGFL